MKPGCFVPSHLDKVEPFWSTINSPSKPEKKTFPTTQINSDFWCINGYKQQDKASGERVIHKNPYGMEIPISRSRQFIQYWKNTFFLIFWDKVGIFE